MPGRIVTSTYRYKRPPRKQQAAPLTGPAVVTSRARKPDAAPATVTAPPPANDGRKPRSSAAIVTTVSRKQVKLERASRRREDRPEDPEEAARIRAWLEQAKWGRGPAG